MKVNKAYVDFIHEIYPGRRAYIIEIDSYGYEPMIKDIATDAASFNCVVFTGKDVLKDNVNDVCKEIQKLNPFTSIIIHTNGMVRPIGMSAVSAAEYFVYVPHVSDTKPQVQRYDDKILTSYSKMKSKFIFDVKDDEEIDEVYLLITGLSIKKHDVYINVLTDDFKNTCFKLSQIGFNVYVKYEGVWFDEEESTTEAEE